MIQKTAQIKQPDLTLPSPQRRGIRGRGFQPRAVIARLKIGAILVGLSTSLIATGIYAGAFLPSAFAQLASTGRTITITPPSLTLTVNPGDKSEGRLGLINDSSEDILFSVYVFDMIVTDNHGTPEILPAGTIQNNKYSASSWMGVDNPTLLVKANSRADINYYVQVPSDAGPGGHYAAVLYRPKRIETTKGSGAAINEQLATLVYFDVAGTIKESALVKSFKAPLFSEYGPVKLTAEVTNNGDTHIQPKGTMSVKNMLGKVIATKDIPDGRIFPGGISRLYEQTIGKKWMIGRYEASFTAMYGRSNNLPLVATVAFWVFPWKLALLIVALLVAAILGWLYMRKSKKNPPVNDTQKDADQKANQNATTS